MKIAVCAQGKGIEAQVDQRFGRCAYFVLIDTDTGETDSLANAGAGESGGAGPRSAQLLVGKGVESVAVGNLGPNAVLALNAAGIKIYTGITGTVEETLQMFLNNKLSLSKGATVAEHHGMNK